MKYNLDRVLGHKRFDSRIKSANVQNSERWLGHMLAPAFVMSMFYISGQSYLNMYYTDVLNLTPIAGGMFLALLPIVSKILDAITNIIMGFIIDHTRSKQGKARPWILISGPLLVISSILLFTVPRASTAVQVAWVTISYNLYFCIAFTMYNISHNLLVPLSTRNNKQRDTLAMVSSMGVSMFPGIIVSMVIPVFVLPAIGVDQHKWMLVMSLLSIFALPAVMMEYYFTRERVTEETISLPAEATSKSFKEQLKGCLSSKYWIIIIVVMAIYQIYNNFQATSIIYFSNWVLGTYNDGVTLAMLNMIGQVPLGLGLIFLWPVVNKIGKRNSMIGGFAIAIVGCMISLSNVKSMPVVLIGLILKSIGTLPITYVLTAMLADALDHVEWVNKFRCDGISASICSVIQTVTLGISSGLFNLGLGMTGYIAPPTGATAEEIATIVQPAATQNLFSFGLFLIPAIGFAIVMVLMFFFRVEKDLPQIHADTIARRKAEAEARGEVYVSPEEKMRLEQEELDRVAEQKRIAELKAKCEKKGLDFDTEEKKYQEKLAAKQRKAKK